VTRNLVVKKLKESLGLLFLLPAVVYLIIFIAYPIFYNVVLSFQQVNALNLIAPDKPFVALQNYIEIFDERVLRIAIKNTFIFTIASIGFQFLFGLALAVLFARKFPLNQAYRGILMIAWMIPMLIVGTLGKWFFVGDPSGLINYALMKLHIIGEARSYLTVSSSAMLALIIVNIWKGIPFNMLLMATALTTIPQEIFEAASIDGAGSLQKFGRITLPLLRPQILITITQGFIFTFKAFDLIYVMTNGGPVDSTQILATLSYKLTFVQFNFGTGAAVSNILFVIMMVVGSLYLGFISKDEVIA
jgi:multiple sugar transport system permease protein